MMSVPRPAMFVEMVTAEMRPAWATISASRATFSGLALSSSCRVPRVVALGRHVGRDRHHVELVDLPELVRLGHRGAGHPGELLVEAEVILQRDRGEGLRLLLDLHAVLLVLGLDGLVQPVGPLPP